MEHKSQSIVSLVSSISSAIYIFWNRIRSGIFKAWLIFLVLCIEVELYGVVRNYCGSQRQEITSEDAVFIE